MKRILFFILTFFLYLIIQFVNPVNADEVPAKIMALNYDNASAIVNISAKNVANLKTPTFVKLSKPNRIYFDIDNSVLIGEKQQILFEKSRLKEIRLAQFSTNPDVVRVVLTFEEDFDTSKIKIMTVGSNIIVKIAQPEFLNDYFNTIYADTSEKTQYLDITATAQAVQKVTIPVEVNTSDKKTMEDIQEAFNGTTLSNIESNTYDSVISVDLSSKLKLRTKYFINQYTPKNNGLLVSGIGQISTLKTFYLNSPKRAVIDLPNTYLDKKFRNREISLCSSNTACNDTAKIGQFNINTARIVITSDKAEQFMPIYSKDLQSLFLIESSKLNHVLLESVPSNLSKVYVKKINLNTNELILSFTSPIVHSVMRNDNNINLYLFNVKNYNEQNIVKVLNSNTKFKKTDFSLLPQIGIKISLGITKDDNVKIEESVDAKALRITVINSEKDNQPYITEKVTKKDAVKNKIVLDAGHGGSDYGAIREGINEKDITLDVTKRVQSILRSKGYKVALTRDDDTFVSLEDRVNFSEKENPELFVSIHVNSAVATEPYGVETHWYHDYSKHFAEVVHKHFVKELPETKDRGLFKSKFYVINHTTVPAILCEIGFISNQDERNALVTDARKQKTAKAIAEGIIEYLKEAK